MDIEIGNKKFQLKELGYLDVVFELPKIEDNKEKHVKLLELSGLSKEDIDLLTVGEGKKLMDAINELNGFSSDFQKTSKVDAGN